MEPLPGHVLPSNMSSVIHAAPDRMCSFFMLLVSASQRDWIGEAVEEKTFTYFFLINTFIYKLYISLQIFILHLNQSSQPPPMLISFTMQSGEMFP